MIQDKLIVFLTAEFVDKYKSDPNFKERAEVGIQFLRLNQKNETLKINMHALLLTAQ